MKYQVLARRYRPRQFEEVVGQESIAATLRGAIQQDRIAHAYVFAGPRGVGKTSMARIFARALNCPAAAGRSGDRSEGASTTLPGETSTILPRGTPCGACSICEAVHAGQDIDVVELDGASHRGIEDIRSIIEGVNRPATRSPYKVYIIDEVHMLTREAFNALLKTLEEPPPHVKFVFATTEPHRIPETVLSRCQRFDFQPIGPDAIVRRLSQILEAEGRSAEDGLLERIARYGKGGLRDAETLLDQLMTFTEGVLRVEDLDQMTGRVPFDLVSSLAGAALGRDPAAVLRLVRSAFEKGADPALLLEQTIEIVRGRLHEAVLGETGERPGSSTDPPAIDRLLAAVQVLLEGVQKLKYSSSPEASAELILLKVARLEDPAQLESVIKALLEVEARDEGRRGPPVPGAPRTAPASPVPAAPRASPRAVFSPDQPPAFSPDQPPPVDPQPVEPPASSSALDFRALLSVWGQVGVELEARHPDIAPYFKERQPAPARESDTFVFELDKEFYFRQMRMPERLEAFVGIVRDVSRAPWKCRLEHAGKSLQFPTGVGREVLPGSEHGSPRPGPGSPRSNPGSPRSTSGSPHSNPEISPRSDAGDLGSPHSNPEGGSLSRTPAARPAAPPPSVEPGPSRAGDGISRSALVKKSLDLFRGRLV